ncbi:DUF255 domain-containing protein [Luteolibacter marinus]|uniref:DUF255 domain-containing protein n=1 Tax=Luteolibacter marinus TaxID=2776705 RepID=UPI001865E0F8|nr:DUF255 domain-containing protein [Luteolibacter marinus]
MFRSGHRVLLLAALLVNPSCRDHEATAVKAGKVPVVDPRLLENRMQAGAPQGLLASRADSPVHWQHWDPAVLTRASKANRLVVAFIGSATYPGCVDSLDAIDRNSALVARLNDEFVPVLVDLDLAREAGLAAGLLSQELKLPVGFPFLLVLSPTGNEVAWRPIHYRSEETIDDVFTASIDVVARMWQEDPEYVERNSTKDHANRLARLPRPDTSPPDAAVRSEFLTSSARQLVSLYDADIGTLSGTGGLLPIGILQCLASASLDPEMPRDVATRSGKAVAAFADNVLKSAMVDPLDGGIYASRRGKSWNLPTTNRNCMTQARAARAFVTLHAATAEPGALDAAVGAVRFAEEQFAVQDGLFANQRQPQPDTPNDGLWTLEQIESILTPKETELWTACCDLKALGNLTDAGGDFFRLNSLGFRTGLREAAVSVGIDPADAAGILESGRLKLLAARQARQTASSPASAALAAPSFRMISAYAAVFTATGDSTFRDKAVALAGRCRETFAKGNLLVEQNPPLPAETCDARAFTYALAIQAALDLAEITLDENWRIWAGDLATTVAENFVTDDGKLVEARPAVTPLQMPIEDRVMLFDDSTAGIMRMNLARLDSLGQPPPPAIAPWMTSLPPMGIFPVICTDSILATAFARSRVILELPADASAEWRDAVTRLPLDRIARRIGTANAVSARRPDGSVMVIQDPGDLPKIVFPAQP